MDQENKETKYEPILTKGLQSSLDSTPIEDGKLRYCTDTGKLFLDQVKGDSSQRMAISSIEEGYTEEEIADIIAPLPKVYLSSDTHRMYVHTILGWIDIAAVMPNATAVKDEDQLVWFAGKTDDQPVYDESLTYNSAKKQLSSNSIKVTESAIVGDMIITDTKDEDGSHTVRFSFVDAE